MGVYRHPHLTRGIVRTAYGAFAISRGLVEVPDELGEALGWSPVDNEGDTHIAQRPASYRDASSDNGARYRATR